MSAAGYAVGIDVGTTFTAAAIHRDGRAEAASLGDHGDVVPSVVFLREDGELLVGDAAERRAVADPTRVARAFKRRIGDGVPLSLGGHLHTPEALTAAIVRWVVDLVTAREGGPPDRVVLTLPASWRDHRRELLQGAAARTGVDGVELLAEPVAAAVHHSARHDLPAGALVGIYDLGGGTFDATIVRRLGGSHGESHSEGPDERPDEGFEIVGQPQGDDHLGGIDFDTLVWDHVVGVVGADRLDVDDPSPRQLRALAQLRAAAVDAKEALSYDTQAVVPITLAGLMTEVRITRSEFEEMARPDVLRTVEVFARTCALAGVAPADLHAVLLVGGSSRIPMIGQLVEHELGARVVVDAHPKLATCLGAARAAATLPSPTADTAAVTVAVATAVPPAGPADRATEESALPVDPRGGQATAGAVPGAGGAMPERGGGRGRRVLVLGSVALVVAAAAVFGVLQLVDEPTDPATGEEASATTTTTSAASTTTIAPETTSTTAAATAPGDDPGTVGSTEPSTTTTSSTTSTTSTSPPEVTPGSACDPADGNPDCTDSGGDGFRIVSGYGECVSISPDPDLCADLDGNDVAGYPDSG